MMESKLLEGFLTGARDGKVGVIMFLMNGYQLRGTIAGFDGSVVVLITEGKQQVIYRHAISTIVPERTVALHQ